MVRWYHLIPTGYGFWLPNDPRGSWSEFVGAWEIYKFGGATKTDEKRSLAREPHDVGRRLAAKRALKYPVVRFNEAQREAIGEGFAVAVRESGYQIHACCVGHDHVHLIVARHVRWVERVGSHLKSKATMALTRRGIHPLGAYRNATGTFPRPWSDGVWSVFIDDWAQLNSAICYVRRHPEKEGLSAQVWSFVEEAVGGVSLASERQASLPATRRGG